jgi:transposase
MKKAKVRKAFLDELKRVPIVQVACEKVGVSRNSVYRWKAEDAEFAKAMEDALGEGEALVNDMTESQLLSLIREKNWHAISFWLRKRNPKFRDRLEVNTKVEQADVPLTPEQEGDRSCSSHQINNMPLCGGYFFYF